MELLIKCLGILLLAVLCSQLVRDKTGWASLGLALCSCGAVLAVLADPLVALMNWCHQTAELFDGAELMTPLLRCLGIGIAVRLSAEICRDAGERALAVKAELAGAVCGLMTILPLVERVMELISQL